MITTKEEVIGEEQTSGVADNWGASGCELEEIARLVPIEVALLLKEDSLTLLVVKKSNTPDVDLRSWPERLEWWMLKQDEGMVEEWCCEIGVDKVIFLVCMHNNKHTFLYLARRGRNIGTVGNGQTERNNPSSNGDDGHHSYRQGGAQWALSLYLWGIAIAVTPSLITATFLPDHHGITFIAIPIDNIIIVAFLATSNIDSAPLSRLSCNHCHQNTNVYDQS
ncbi:hypothetical protein ZIOFF_070810 [Zingiber officinale]|uniref:Uncharacterized protein n=1 Tax=Zingiber officinale TaxID=94328 RepID=A0A8J5EB38_ZINOF|nr:hypothetical protein ZIOFF_070810 [Zingiber officinale]